MPIYDTVAIIGLGLIGSSVVRATELNGLAAHINTYDADANVREVAAKIGLGNVKATLHETVCDADLLMLCVPVGAMASVAEAIQPHLKAGAVITDTGSTKASVVKDVSPFIPENCYFLPSHPIAGTEYSGPEAGFATLFKGRYWIIIPNDEIPIELTKTFTIYLQGLGAVVETMSIDYHDRILAITSHLPHLIAYTIVGTAFDLEQQLHNDVIRLAASGFRDFTRIAASDPVMWRDVFINNGDAVLEMLGRFSEDLAYLQRAIRWKEADKLEELFTRTRDIRKKIKDIGQLD